MEEVKEWVKVTRPAKGPMIATVTVLSGNCTAKSSVLCYGLTDSVKKGVKEARAQATSILLEILEAIDDAA